VATVFITGSTDGPGRAAAQSLAPIPILFPMRISSRMEYERLPELAYNAFLAVHAHDRCGHLANRNCRRAGLRRARILAARTAD
jgi:hypothetical protein